MLSLRRATLIAGVLITMTTLALAQNSRRTPIVEAYDANKNAVVSISSAQVRPTRNSFFDFNIDDMFFGRPRMQVIPSLGSGFIFDTRGYVLTNAHVVERAAAVKVVLSDEQAGQHDAQIVAMDPSSDLAVLKIDTDQPLSAVQLGYSDDLMIGETVLAIGNPFGYQQTLTDGILSAFHRDLEFEGGIGLSDLLQISAPINPGNSGGPLLNINGHVIGMNTAIRRASQGIGFAIPIGQIREKLTNLLDLETLHRIDIGIEAADIKRTDDDIRQGIIPQGVEVIAIKSGSAADRAQLQPGDRLVAINDRPISAVTDYLVSLIESNEAKQIQLQAQQADGLKKTITIPLYKKPMPDALALMKQFFGIDIALITPNQADKLGLSETTLLITEVDPDSDAAQANIEKGDILMALSNTEINDVEQLGLILEQFNLGDQARFVIGRLQRKRWFIEQLRFERVLKVKNYTKDQPPEVF